jgi:SAM-dependent methyltransferase
MANETSKTKRLWGPLEKSILKGSGIDIGCGSDPVLAHVCKFDVEQGDANRITQFVHEQFDFVYSSHCLEHMDEPRHALLEWWKLVKPGGHLIFIVPDEDLYEQGVFPSRFQPGHRATFTISKARSWSPVSHNVLDLALGLPNGNLISLVLQDQGYDRSLMRHGQRIRPRGPLRFVLRLYKSLRKRGLFRIPFIEVLQPRYLALDQTLGPDAIAQIQCIVQKEARVAQPT